MSIAPSWLHISRAASRKPIFYLLLSEKASVHAFGEELKMLCVYSVCVCVWRLTFGMKMTKSRANVLVVFALEGEAQGLFTSFAPVYCGVGKVNAAYRLTRALAEWRREYGRLPERVLNLGSAGSAHFDAGTVVNCTRFIQRDMDTTVLGTAAYATPFEEGAACLENGARFAGFEDGICGSGDNFVTDGARALWNVVDMEAYALAKICLLEGVSFGCLKFITDGADGHAADTWEGALKEAAQVLRRSVDAIGFGDGV